VANDSLGQPFRRFPTEPNRTIPIPKHTPHGISFRFRLPGECVRLCHIGCRGGPQCGPCLQPRSFDVLRLRPHHQSQNAQQEPAPVARQGEEAVPPVPGDEPDSNARGGEEVRAVEDRQSLEVGRLLPQHGLWGRVLQAVPRLPREGRRHPVED